MIHIDFPPSTEEFIREMAVKNDPCTGKQPQKGNADGLLVDKEYVESGYRREGIKGRCGAGKE